MPKIFFITFENKRILISIFQKSVVNKYRKNLDNNKVAIAFENFCGNLGLYNKS